MNCKYPNIEAYSKKFYEKFPKSEVKILDLIDTKTVKIQDNYGICVCNRDTLMWYGKSSIKSAVNKTLYFIEQLREVHHDIYDYKDVIYTNAKTKLDIICVLHGEFTQLPNTHLSGGGCPECGREKRDKSCTKSEGEYIGLLDKVHQGKYIIKKGTYKNRKIKIPHFCDIQKDWFLMRPSHVLGGQGCRVCRNKLISERNKITSTGWSYSKWEEKGKKSKHFSGFKVYIIKCTNNKTKEEFYKIGKTFQNIKRRFQSNVEMPYAWELIKIYNGEALEMSKLERKLININKKHQYLPSLKFNGMYECFKELKNYENIFM